MTTAIVSGFWNEDNMAWVRRLLEMSEPIYPGTNDNDVA